MVIFFIIYDIYNYFIMGCTQYLDLALEHRFLVRIWLSFRGYVRALLYSPLV